MTFLLDKRRGTIAALGAVVATAALFFGAGSASAATGPCDDDAFPTDVWLGVGGIVFVGTQPFSSPGYTGAWVCAKPPGTATAVQVKDTDPTAVGATVNLWTCDPTCHSTLGPTGAEVEAPTGAPNLPGGGDGTGGVVNAPGNCLYVNGTSGCESHAELVIVTVAEGDLPEIETQTDCIDVNGTCQVPIVNGARVTVFGDTANETFYVDTLAGGASDEGLPTCVGVGYRCP